MVDRGRGPILHRNPVPSWGDAMDNADRLARSLDASGEKVVRAIAQLAQTLEGSVAALGARLAAIETAMIRLVEIEEARLDPAERASLKLSNLRSSVASLKTSVEEAHGYTPRR